METVTFDVELTDTFGGDLNYSWVHREALVLPAGISRKALVHRAKKAMGITGVRCRVNYDLGDTIRLDLCGHCEALLIQVRY